jgi:arginyl-tRNA synthetase
VAHYTPLHAAAAAAVGGEAKVDTPPRPELGDFAVGCFQLAKARGTNPAQLAKELAAAFQPTDWLASASAAGPFVNFRANRAAAFRWVVEATLGGTLVPRTLGAGQTICIDYSSPNVSKHLAYHHIRSTMIGHSLAEMFRALGYRVVGINHLGDWGTTHGMLIAAWKQWGPDGDGSMATGPLDITALTDLYVRFNKEPDAKERARAWFKRLEDGDPEARALWKRFYDVSVAEFQAVYDQLGVRFDEIRGESAYEADLPRVIAELRARKLLVESEGAQVVPLEGEDIPIMLIKADGSTKYETRDVAAAEYRWNTYHFARSLYIVGGTQAQHFRMLFKLLAKMGYEWASRCEHVPFGQVQIGGKKAATREGNVVLLKDVLREATERVRKVMAETNPTLLSIDEVARQVGIGAVVFANLASQREKNVEFDWDKVTSLSGDSGPYLQYSHARCAAIARKAGEPATADADFTKLAHDAEWAVARRLLELPDAVVRAADGREPHVICHYLLELAGEFSRWYTLGNGDPSLRVLVDDAPTRRARLALVGAVQAALRQGLSLLGIAAPEQM